MSAFTEPKPHLVAPNPGGGEDPLGESVLDLARPWLRVFAPGDVRLVIGRHQDPERELRVQAAQADGVPIHRRVSGGGAVVLAPGMVVVAARLRADGDLGPDHWFARINAALIPAVAACAGTAPTTHGHGDLALAAADGAPRKILGASLRQTARLVAYLGVLLVEDAVPLMERYLATPSREPAYRAGRGHRAFCGNLACYGVGVRELIAAITAEADQRLAGWALP